jgi:hypothetical protein
VDKLHEIFLQVIHHQIKLEKEKAKEEHQRNFQSQMKVISKNHLIPRDVCASSGPSPFFLLEPKPIISATETPILVRVSRRLA